jgi:hypothetical protein
METNWPAHIKRKSRWRKAANDDGWSDVRLSGGGAETEFEAGIA